MNCGILIKSIPDGITQMFGLVFLYSVISSEYMYHIPLSGLLLISFLVAMLLTLYYIWCLFKEGSNKKIVIFFLGSLCSFIISVLLLFAVYLFVQIDFSCMRKLNNADGIVILLTTGCFTLSSFLLRLCTLSGLVVKNIYMSKFKRTKPRKNNL